MAARETAADRIETSAWRIGGRADLTVASVRHIAHIGALEAFHVLEMSILSARDRRLRSADILALIRTEKDALEAVRK